VIEIKAMESNPTLGHLVLFSYDSLNSPLNTKEHAIHKGGRRQQTSLGLVSSWRPLLFTFQMCRQQPELGTQEMRMKVKSKF
jgi:hypothetical protein